MSLGLTINGIDGFLSGNWTIHANAKVIDDETLELNANGTYQKSTLLFNIIGGLDYCFKGIFTANEYYDLILLDKQNTQVLAVYNINSSNSGVRTFTAPSTAVKVSVEANNSVVDTFTFKRPTLNLGDIPAPYEKKRGDRMVLPVAKKNVVPLFNNSWVLDASHSVLDNGEKLRIVGNYTISNVDINVIPNKTYYLNLVSDNGYVSVDKSGTSTGIVTGRSTPTSFVIPSDVYKIRINVFKTDGGTGYVSALQLEEGTVGTPYEPYAVQINQKSARRTPTDSGVLSAVRTKLSSGLLCNGTTDYLQLPSMTMDSIEIECLIDSVQSQSNPFIFDARSGSSAWIFSGGVGADVNEMFVNGISVSKVWGSIPRNSRIKVKSTFTRNVTDDISIFGDGDGAFSSITKGTLYKVICYLAGNIVAQYDFEKQNTDVSSLLRGKPIWLLKQAVR